MAKGLDVARDFFQEWGLPYLQTQHPYLVDRVAALICGGSQSLGNDDELSMDHAWGPHFLLVLTGKDMRHFGRKLKSQINQAAPREWKDYTFRFPATSIDVASINPWFRNYVGCEQPPKTDWAWRKHTSEDYLYMLRHATIFHDPLGEFSARQQAFRYYPERIWLQRVIREIYQVWHFGQYNFIVRLTHRRDSVAISVCIGRFIEGVMRLSMLLAREYAPYWKWLAAEFRKLPNVEQIDAWLHDLSRAQDVDSQASLISNISREMHIRLIAQFDLDPDPKVQPGSLWWAKNELARREGLKG